MVKGIIPLIEDEFQNWKPDFKVKDFEAEFWLVSVSIPQLNEELVEWEWSFETVHDVNHTLTVHMHDDIPQGIHFDG